MAMFAERMRFEHFSSLFGDHVVIHTQDAEDLVEEVQPTSSGIVAVLLVCDRFRKAPLKFLACFILAKFDLTLKSISFHSCE